MTDLVAALSVDAARRLTERIRIKVSTARESIEQLQDLIEQAREGRAAEVLGFPSWTAYLADVFSDAPMLLAGDDRREIVAVLSAEGMSTRAIAPIVGASHMTVARDLAGVTPVTPALKEGHDVPPAEVTSHLSPAPESLPEFQHRVLAEAEATGTTIKLTGPGSVTSPDEGEDLQDPQTPRAITGLDGKTYTRPTPPAEPRTPNRKPITDAFFNAAFDLERQADRVKRLVEDDRFTRNRDAIAARNLAQMRRTASTVAAVLAALEVNPSQETPTW